MTATTIQQAPSGWKHASARPRRRSGRRTTSRLPASPRLGCTRVPAVTPGGWTGVGCHYFLNNRYQNPTTGTFISVDPLIAKTGHPYDYANNNPVAKSDPSGLDPDDQGPCGGRADGNVCVTSLLTSYLPVWATAGLNSAWDEQLERLEPYAQAALTMGCPECGSWSPGDFLGHIQSVSKSGVRFVDKVGKDLTVAYLGRVNGNQHFVAHYFLFGENAGRLATAFIPSNGQLLRYFDTLYKNGPR